jgi:hypothetical protein
MSDAILNRVSLLDEPSKQPLPSELTLEDHRFALIKGGISALPFVGGVLAEEMGLLLITPLTRRRDEWWADVARRVLDLEGKVHGFKFEDLGNNEQFVSAMIQATQSATKTHLKEKLEALRNAVLNVALGKAPDPDRQQQFLMLVDRFSETHLVVLKFLNNPSRHFQTLGQPAPQLNHVQSKMLLNVLIGQAFPSPRKAPNDPTSTSFQFVELVLGDLVPAHLVALERHQETWAVPAFAIKPGGGAIGKMANHLGEDFLTFITEPDFQNS